MYQVLTGHGDASPCSFYPGERNVWVVVNGDDFLSGGLGKQLEWLKKVTNKHFESKHVMMGESSDLAKSIVTLDRRIS